MASPSDLINLASVLREENIFVRAETHELSRLNRQLSADTEKLYHEAWIARSQRRALELLLSQRSDLPADNCLSKLNSAATSKTVDGYRVLGYKESAYGDCLKVVRENPELLAECLVRGERSSPEKMQEALRCVLGSLYGYGLIPEDQEYSLKLLKSLIEIQLDANSNPRRLLKNVSTFSYAYKIFVDNLHETKLYLAAALHQPILQVLAEDDHILEVDANKLAFRMSSDERRKRFGDEGSEQYNLRLKEYRNRVVSRLVRLANLFIQGLVDNLFCFPPSLCWIISQVYERIQSQHPTQTTLPAIVCTDLIFAHFICPAIVQPEPYALTSDIPVSPTARLNLMQIAQILQTLAVSKWETIDAKLMDVYNFFKPDCIWRVLDGVLDMRTSDILVTPATAPDSLNRAAVFMSVSELNFLVGFLKDTSADKPGSRVPSDIFRNLVTNLPLVEPPKKRDSEISASVSMNTLSSSASKTNLKAVLAKSFDAGNFFQTDSDAQDSSLGSSGSSTGQNSNSGAVVPPEDTQVLVISLGAREMSELGLLPEQKVIAISKRRKKTRFSEDQDSFEAGSMMDDEAMSAFSVCSSIPDSVSVTGHGKPSEPLPDSSDSLIAPNDGLGAVLEEMVSHHSTASSVDGVDVAMEADNLSDPVSPDISARASPTVSGRDTPSPPPDNPALIDIALPQPNPVDGFGFPQKFQPRDLPVTVNKPGRADVSDKFGKFDIPDVKFDETRSTVSEAWSTEVGGSEFDAPGIVPPPAIVAEFDPMNDPVFAVAAAGGFDSDNEDDRWSVDVAASVSNASQEPLEDRLAELENEPQGPVNMVHDLLMEPMEEPVPLPAVLPNPPGKYVSFANDDQFHHYPPENENEFLIGSYGSTGGLADRSRDFEDRARDFEDDDPTLNPFVPSTSHGHNVFGSGSVQSSCSSFSNLSGFDEPSTSSGKTHPVLEKSVSAGLFGNVDPFGQSPFNVPTGLHPFEGPKGPLPGRKGSLCRETVSIIKEPSANRPSLGNQLGIKDFQISKRTSDSALSSLANSGSKEGSNKKGNFLKNIAQNLRVKQKRSSGGRFDPPATPPRQINQENPFNQNNINNQKPAFAQNESPDDILARYRKKPLLSTNSSASSLAVNPPTSPAHSVQMDTGDHVYLMDFAGISDEVMLEAAKRKVRIVLSSFDAASVPYLKMRLSNKDIKANNSLLPFLKIQLSEAIGLQDRSLIAQLHEAIRCVKALDSRGVKKLVEALRNDYRGREVYMTYLIRSRKTLLNNLQHTGKLIKRTQRDSNVCSKYFISVCVTHFLEKRERDVHVFIRDFQRLTLSDEKSALVENILTRLYGFMTSENLWHACTEEQCTDAREALERQILSRVYRSAMYPNDEVDIMRDQVLHEHMKRLARTLTPDHKDLKISKAYHLECPWPSAQAEIKTINAYKTPKDKVQCVVRCSATLMNLLSLATDNAVPAADDFMPALVYVLIRASPPGLLSTVQYVNTFYGSRLFGEEAYWWTQFASAIEYIKNMDYPAEGLFR